MLYELLVGVPAFEGDGAMLMLSIANDQPVPPSSLRRDIDIPTAIDNAVMKALSKSRSKRFQTVYQLALDLRAFASPRGQLLIDQIARLAGEEPPAAVAPPASDDGAMTFSRSLRPSEPPSSHAAGAPYPLARPSQPASQPPVSQPPAPQYGSYAPAVVSSPPSAPPAQLAPQQVAAALQAPRLPSELSNDIELAMAQQPTFTFKKLMMAAMVTLTPVAIVLFVYVLAQGDAPAVAQEGIELPAVDDIVAQVEVEEETAAPVASEMEPEADDATEADEDEADEPGVTSTAPIAAAGQPTSNNAASSQFMDSLGSKKSKKSSRKKKSSKSKKRSEKKSEENGEQAGRQGHPGGHGGGLELQLRGRRREPRLELQRSRSGSRRRARRELSPRGRRRALEDRQGRPRPSRHGRLQVLVPVANVLLEAPLRGVCRHRWLARILVSERRAGHQAVVVFEQGGIGHGEVVALP